MGKYCEICGKGVMSGNNVSHSNRKSKRAWAPNIQTVHVMDGEKPVKLNICTRCLRNRKSDKAAKSV